jgi:hypothetical protein
MHIVYFIEKNDIWAVTANFDQSTGDFPMKFRFTTVSMIAAAFLLSLNAPAMAAKGGNKGGKDEGGAGNQNAVVALQSTSPYIPYVESQSFDNKGQVVFYGQMDMSGFAGRYDERGDPPADHDWSFQRAGQLASNRHHHGNPRALGVCSGKSQSPAPGLLRLL